MWKFWKKLTVQDPHFGLLSYSNQQWLSEQILTSAGSILVSFDGDKSGPNPASISLAQAVLVNPVVYLESAMAFAHSSPEAREFMEYQGDLILDGFSFLSAEMFYVNLALSEWPDGVIDVVFKQGLPCNILLSD